MNRIISLLCILLLSSTVVKNLNSAAQQNPDIDKAPALQAETHHNQFVIEPLNLTAAKSLPLSPENEDLAHSGSLSPNMLKRRNAYAQAQGDAQNKK